MCFESFLLVLKGRANPEPPLSFSLPVLSDGFACRDIQTVTPYIFKSEGNQTPVSMLV